MAMAPDAAQAGARAAARSDAPAGAARSGGLRVRLDVRRWRRAGDAWRWAPLACAAFYLVALLATLRSLVSAIYLNADVVAAPDIGQLVSRAPTSPRSCSATPLGTPRCGSNS
jgi:hypothetical protein